MFMSDVTNCAFWSGDMRAKTVPLTKIYNDQKEKK